PPRPPLSALFPYTTLFRSGAANHAEERALIRRLDRFPGLAQVAGAEHAAHLADDEQAGAFDMGDGVQVKAVLVVQAVADVVPVLDRKSTRLNSSHVKISYA